METSTRLKPSSRQTLVTLLRLAWRNIWRQRRRTLLLIAVVAYATLATIFFWGLNDGLNNSIIEGQARFLVAPMMVMSEAYNQDPNPENALPSLELAERLAALPEVKAVAPRLEFPALLRSPYGSEGARIRGVAPGPEVAVSAVPAKVFEGRMLTAPGEAVLGRDMAARLDVRLGERLVVDASALAGPQGLGLKVVGLIDAGLAAVDSRMVLIHIEDARQLTGVPTATGLALAVATGQAARIQQAVQAQLPSGLKAYDLLSLLGVVATRVRVSRLLMLPVGLLFAFFAALAVTSTVLVSVMERRKEFGMVAAIGVDPSRLALMVVFETLLTTLLGWLLGLGLGYGLIAFLHSWNLLGLFLASAARSLVSFGIGEEIYTDVSPLYALYATLTIVVAALLAVLLPARRVTKLEPVIAMRD